MRCEIYGEDSIIIYFKNCPSAQQSENITLILDLISKKFKSFIDGVASYTTLVIFYDVNKISATKAHDTIKSIVNKAKTKQHYNKNNKLITIDVCYDEKVAPDILTTLKNTKLTKNEFIALHTKPKYRVYTIGFLPNFAYLGKVDDKICIKRLSSPRQQIPQGSVGIADCQTGIYPQQSPGGWNIVGRTPTDVSINSNIKFNIGDIVLFNSISYDEYCKSILNK